MALFFKVTSISFDTCTIAPTVCLLLTNLVLTESLSQLALPRTRHRGGGGLGKLSFGKPSHPPSGVSGRNKLPRTVEWMMQRNTVTEKRLRMYLIGDNQLQTLTSP